MRQPRTPTVRRIGRRCSPCAVVAALFAWATLICAGPSWRAWSLPHQPSENEWVVFSNTTGLEEADLVVYDTGQIIWCTSYHVTEGSIRRVWLEAQLSASEWLNLKGALKTTGFLTATGSSSQRTGCAVPTTVGISLEGQRRILTGYPYYGQPGHPKFAPRWKSLSDVLNLLHALTERRGKAYHPSEVLVTFTALPSPDGSGSIEWPLPLPSNARFLSDNNGPFNIECTYSPPEVDIAVSALRTGDAVRIGRRSYAATWHPVFRLSQ